MKLQTLIVMMLLAILVVSPVATAGSITGGIGCSISDGGDDTPGPIDPPVEFAPSMLDDGGGADDIPVE
jgi:hypothetical protein